jgi:predicted transcriptional regulator
MVTPFSNAKLTSLAAGIVSAYVSRNTVSPDALPALIKSVHSAMGGLDGEAAVPVAAGPKPAVPVKQSVFADYIVCLEDGKKLKSLKRHLQLSFGLTPEDYRKRWGLPSTYPMVAPNYAATRSKLAKKAGLGRKSPAAPEQELPLAEDDQIAGAPPIRRIPESRRGRKKASLR